MKNAAILALLSCAMALTTAAYSQTWVSNSGSDSNPCTMAAPCRTFAYAVAQTPAWGQLGVLNAGDYGPVTITQAIRIDGGGFASNFVTGSLGIEVNTPSGSVVQLHNLSLHGANGSETGIEFNGVGGLDIDNVQLTGFGIGIDVTSTSSQNLVVKDTTIENIAYYGICIGGPSATNLASAEIINTHVRFANTGIYATYAAISVLNSTFVSPNAGSTPGSYGVGIETFNSNIYLDNSQINGYRLGVYAGGTGMIQINRSSFLNNLAAVETAASVITNGSNTSFNNTFQSVENMDHLAPTTAATMW